jgi:hypothetical protein
VAKADWGELVGAGAGFLRADAASFGASGFVASVGVAAHTGFV